MTRKAHDAKKNDKILWTEITDDIQNRAIRKDPGFRLSGPWKQFVRVQESFQVYLVDGEWVRNNLSVIFGHGGHGLVHEFIPMNEIWLGKQHFKDCEEVEGIPEGRLTTREWFESCLLHEINEFRRMNQGAPYWKAHNHALDDEEDLGLLEDPDSDPVQ